MHTLGTAGRRRPSPKVGLRKGMRRGEGGRWGCKWGQCKIKLITSNYATDLIGERDSVRSLSSPIIRPVRDPSDARLIRRTLMKLAKQLLFSDSWVRSVAGVGSVCSCACVWCRWWRRRRRRRRGLLEKERGRVCGITERTEIFVELCEVKRRLFFFFFFLFARTLERNPGEAMFRRMHM